MRQGDPAPPDAAHHGATVRSRLSSVRAAGPHPAVCSKRRGSSVKWNMFGTGIHVRRDVAGGGGTIELI